MQFLQVYAHQSDNSRLYPRNSTSAALGSAKRNPRHVGLEQYNSSGGHLNVGVPCSGNSKSAATSCLFSPGAMPCKNVAADISRAVSASLVTSSVIDRGKKRGQSQVLTQTQALDAGFSSRCPVQRNQVHAAVLSRDQRQAKPAVFFPKAARDTPEGAPRPGEEFVGGHLCAGAFGFHSTSRIRLNSITVQVSDSARSFGAIS